MADFFFSLIQQRTVITSEIIVKSYFLKAAIIQGWTETRDSMDKGCASAGMLLWTPKNGMRGSWSQQAACPSWLQAWGCNVMQPADMSRHAGGVGRHRGATTKLRVGGPTSLSIHL